MAFCVTGDDRYRYFTYKGKHYGNGTKVVLSNEFINKYTFNGKRIWKYAWFGHRYVVNGKSAYFFSRDKTDWYFLHENNIDQRYINECCSYFSIDAELIDMAIEQVIHPIEVIVPEHKKQKDWENSKVIRAWVIYIAILFFSLIFKQFYLIWIVATIVFYFYRKEELNNDC